MTYEHMVTLNYNKEKTLMIANKLKLSVKDFIINLTYFYILICYISLLCCYYYVMIYYIVVLKNLFKIFVILF